MVHLIDRPGQLNTFLYSSFFLYTVPSIPRSSALTMGSRQDQEETNATILYF